MTEDTCFQVWLQTQLPELTLQNAQFIVACMWHDDKGLTKRKVLYGSFTRLGRANMFGPISGLEELNGKGRLTIYVPSNGAWHEG
jgi:hypothetical protein